ncbi:YceI-like domain-containing protein [Lutibacter agarilyticus]|uniref:YceI-like domain-containing protein n=1 Tax=Lutibacter agarilyticus TaxID=1109740 RepID=A0A238WC02_9FLAO|nr:YceI family protein [Lutibacter agarilyticus]SNR44082.1 YceI-like domain-containing protein [Lutibacter agarilyticus]
MKKFVLILVIGVGLIACKNDKKATPANENLTEAKAKVQQIEKGTYVANTETSTLNWKGFKPTGEHNGTVAIKDGSLVISEGNLSGGSFTFDMTAITVLDIPAEDEYNAKLVGHLKNEDFFDVANHKTATFEITSVDGVNVKGNLTVKGITKPIEFEAILAKTESGIELTGETFKIDRTQFGIEYKSKSIFENLKDKFINDEFEISFKVEASK